MKTRNVWLLIIVLMLLAGCNVPKAGQNNDNNTSSDEISFGNHKRPDGEYISLRIGEYRVGTDVKAGRYYLYKEKINGSGSTELVLYDEEDKYDDFIYPEYDSPSVYLTDGRKIEVRGGPITLSTEYVHVEDFYEIEKIEGTTVPAGSYLIGTHIPAGSYELYPTKFSGTSAAYFADAESFKNKDDSNARLLSINFDEEHYGQLFYFNEGGLLITKDKIIMKKVDALNFE